jgi:hypothetical protein
MKKLVFYLSLLSIIFLSACQKETQQEYASFSSSTKKTDWLNSKLDANISQSKQSIDCYLFKPEDLSGLLNTQNLYEVRFVLGYEKGGIQINAVGVNFLGDELKRVPSKTFFDASFDQKLLKLNTSLENIVDESSLVSNYLLSPKKSLTYIQDYRKKIMSGNELNEIALFKGERIDHFCIEKKVLSEMVMMNKAAYIALFLGVNKGKLTAVSIGMDQNKNLVLPMSEKEETDFSGYVFGLSKQCLSTNIVSNP